MLKRYARPTGRARRVAAVAALGVTALLASACAGGGGARGGDQIRIILGHGAAPGNPRSDAALEFEKIVQEKSGGQIDVQILGQEAVGSDTAMMVSVASGSLDMTVNSQGPFATYVPEASLIGLPFLFENSRHAYSVVDGTVEEQLTAKAAEKGFHVLGFWDNGMRDITNSERAINGPADVRGLKLRTPDDTMTIDIFSALGANPTPMAFGEVYLGLRTGAIDGQENPVTNIKSAKLQEVQKHLAVTGHKYEVNPFVMSTARWERLTPQQQQIVADGAKQAREIQRQLMQEQTTKILDEFDSEMQVTHPDRTPFRQATRGVYDKWQGQFPEFFDVITQAAEADRSQYQGGAQ